MINIGPKGHYVQKGPTPRATTFQKDWAEGFGKRIVTINTGPKGHCVKKDLKDHYVKIGFTFKTDCA
jgi:hypothetical protein